MTGTEGNRDSGQRGGAVAPRRQSRSKRHGSSGVDREFSVLLPVHGTDDPAHFLVAANSVLDQTVMPDEVVVVGDGSVGDTLRDVLETVRDGSPVPFRFVELDGDRSLGLALREGVRACRHEWIARMDADDVAVSDRFERQLSYLCENPGVDVLGGHVAEFDTDPRQASRVREVPTDPERVRQIAQYRCPVNHPTVMFRRSSVKRAGNYRGTTGCLEDYDLWVRVLQNGGVIANQDAVLVRMRTGEQFAQRRGGGEYLRAELRLFRQFRRQGFIGYPQLLLNVLVRVPVRLSPAGARRVIYCRLLR